MTEIPQRVQEVLDSIRDDMNRMFDSIANEDMILVAYFHGRMQATLETLDDDGRESRCTRG